MKKIWIAFGLCMLAGAAHAQGFGVPGGGSSDTPDADAVNVIGDSADLYKFYVGADYQFLTLSVLNSQGAGGFPQQHYYGRLYDFRVGYRLLKNVGFELHYGVNGRNNSKPNGFEFTRYYGVFIVPTATVLNTFELSVPVGYAFTGVKQRVSGQSEYRASINSAAFGVNIELPLQQFFGSIPDLRLTGGGVVYVQRNNAQIYGFHAGLRYDFGFGAPSASGSEAGTSSGAVAPEDNTSGGGAPGGGAPGGGAPGGGAPGGGAPGGGAPGGGAPGGGAPGGGAPGGGAPGGGAPGGGAPGGGAPSGGAAPAGGSSGTAAPAGGAPPI